MGYNMKGWSGFQNSPMKQKPVTTKDKQVPLSEHEDKKGTMITGGSESEVMIDLEDRIEFLTSDIQDGNTDPKVKAQLEKLKKELAKYDLKRGAKQLGKINK